MYKPDDRNAVSPYLIVDDAAKALAFVKAVFGSAPIFIHHRNDGSIQHAEVRIEDSVVMIGQMSGGPHSHVHVYVPNLDAAFDRALAAGGELVQALSEEGGGDRRGGIIDPTGTTWWLATMVDAASRNRTNAV